MNKPATLRLVPAVVVERPAPAPAAPLNDYQWRQDASVQALLYVLGLKEIPHAASTDQP